MIDHRDDLGLGKALKTWACIPPMKPNPTRIPFFMNSGMERIEPANNQHFVGSLDRFPLVKERATPQKGNCCERP